MEDKKIWSHGNKIFDNFDDIEARYETNDILTKIKKNNTEIEQKDIFK